MKPKEFWLEMTECFDMIHDGISPQIVGPNYYNLTIDRREWLTIATKPIENSIHVIEKSAYDELKKECDQWRHWSLMLESQLSGHSMPGYTNSRALADFAEFKKKMDLTEGDE